ncbi:Holliday junction branch migration protein RuvA [Staphylococcus ratti]|uniref:Holliday junction branch migration complex subunit RuvA n=1 Tax=Staphylococcus ratti TaxID=2892440 RepID=A0ABY3PFA6_9STAP|nr:Holliday junction branch migration protein RuvA [Staphylococcus ratti]UEX91022.1 Holliday junction branch migration protein RuvA [Staphylococcus ratti]
MYAYIRGTLQHLYPTHVVIETSSGIAFEIQTPNSYRFQKQLQQVTTIHTALIVREDAQLLYGFVDCEEKDMFLSLIKVTGIGPKSALAILAASTPRQVKLAIENENDAYLTQFPGIGKKTARQIVLDLKGKVVVTEESDDTLIPESAHQSSKVEEEALLALEALGYSKRELNKIEKKMAKETFDSVDEAVKFGLQQLIS